MVDVNIDLGLTAFANARNLHTKRRQAASKEEKTIQASKKVILHKLSLFTRLYKISFTLTCFFFPHLKILSKFHLLIVLVLVCVFKM